MNLFITNREIITHPDQSESVREDGKEHASDTLRFGLYEDRKFKLFPEIDSELEGIYSNAAAKNVDELKGSVRFFRTLYDELTKGGDALFFIHGFNTDLDGVREAYDNLNNCYVNNRASKIKHVIIFTWPGMSPKIPYHYFNDKNDAIHSGEALARGMEKVSKFFKDFLYTGKNAPCNRDIHLMVHSMGHRVLKHMMLELKARGSTTPDLFKEIVLMAADIEYDIFESGNAFNALIELGKRVHVYFHEHDLVLDISKYTKNFSNRLGRYGRKRIDPRQIDVFDANVSEVIDDLKPDFESDKLNHWYYYSSSAVVNDILSVFDGMISKFMAKR